MGKYFARRLASILPTLFFVTILIFGLQQLLPGDPAMILAGEDQDPNVVAYLRQKMHLDQPLPVQYFHWLGGVLRGDLGESLRIQKPVTELILEKLPVTIQLAVMAMLIALAIGITAGIVSAVLKDSAWDYAANVFALWGLSTPNFWFGILLILLFGLALHWFPVAGFGETLPQHIWYLFLPALTLALQLSAVLIRNLRGQIILTLRSDYVRTARAKGLSELVVLLRHVLRNALLSTVTIFGLQFGFLVGGTIVVETVFALPGTGQLLIQSIAARDYPVVQAITVVSAVLVIVVNLAVDLSYSFLDPRVTYE